MPVKRADESHFVGDDPLTGYLDPHALANLAVETGCDAVHPDYGFLSENAECSRIYAARGLIFVGPSAEVIARMGDKTAAVSPFTLKTVSVKIVALRRGFNGMRTIAGLKKRGTNVR